MKLKFNKVRGLGGTQYECTHNNITYTIFEIQHNEYLAVYSGKYTISVQEYTTYEDAECACNDYNTKIDFSHFNKTKEALILLGFSATIKSYVNDSSCVIENSRNKYLFLCQRPMYIFVAFTFRNVIENWNINMKIDKSFINSNSIRGIAGYIEDHVNDNLRTLSKLNQNTILTLKY